MTAAGHVLVTVQRLGGICPQPQQSYIPIHRHLQLYPWLYNQLRYTPTILALEPRRGRLPRTDLVTESRTRM
jgi:hypothetical protein